MIRSEIIWLTGHVFIDGQLSRSPAILTNKGLKKFDQKGTYSQTVTTAMVYLEVNSGQWFFSLENKVQLRLFLTHHIHITYKVVTTSDKCIEDKSFLVINGTRQIKVIEPNCLENKHINWRSVHSWLLRSHNTICTWNTKTSNKRILGLKADINWKSNFWHI